MMRRALTIVALVGGVFAAFAGSPYATQNARVNVDQITSVIASEEDHVTAIELARWIRDRKPGLRVIDLRTAAECNGYHLPGEELIPMESLARTRFDRASTIVLISDGGAHAAQAWVLLRALGHEQVYFLRGGVQEWLDAVMNPANPTPEAASLSRYFGGAPEVAISGAAPHVGPPPPAAAEGRGPTFRRGGC